LLIAALVVRGGSARARVRQPAPTRAAVIDDSQAVAADGVGGTTDGTEEDARDAALSEREQRGKLLYDEGRSASGGVVTAVLSDSATEVPASVLRCSACHGRDGRGVPEGGIFPPNITWAELTKPYGVTAPVGRRRPAYTDILLKRSIGMGIDSAGQPLRSSMPRYRLSIQDADDLVAYVKRLGRSPTPGVTSSTIRVATILPPEGSGSMNRAVAAALGAYFDRINATGRLYGRRIELRLTASPDSPRDRPAHAKSLIESGDVFGLVACFVGGAEDEIAYLAEQAAIPLVGALTLFPRQDAHANRHVFYVDGGVPCETMVLLEHAGKGRAKGVPWDAVLLVAAVETTRDVARQIAERIRAAGGRARIVELTPSLDAAALVREPSILRADTLVALDWPDRLLSVLRAADAAGWHPRVLLPGSLANPAVFDVPDRFASDLLLAFSSVLPLGSQTGLEGYRQFAVGAGLPGDHVPAQLSALASAAVLVEALKRAGRDLSRDSLVEQLDGLVEFATAFSPPLTYTTRRRIGARGAFIAGMKGRVNRFHRLTGWVEPED
jgi:ABC-type branched-subunit amino acid transport system substrate-binding protein